MVLWNCISQVAVIIGVTNSQLFNNNRLRGLLNIFRWKSYNKELLKSTLHFLSFRPPRSNIIYPQYPHHGKLQSNNIRQPANNRLHNNIRQSPRLAPPPPPQYFVKKSPPRFVRNPPVITKYNKLSAPPSARPISPLPSPAPYVETTKMTTTTPKTTENYSFVSTKAKKPVEFKESKFLYPKLSKQPYYRNKIEITTPTTTKQPWYSTSTTNHAMYDDMNTQIIDLTDDFEKISSVESKQQSNIFNEVPIKGTVSKHFLKLFNKPAV